MLNGIWIFVQLWPPLWMSTIWGAIISLKWGYEINKHHYRLGRDCHPTDQTSMTWRLAIQENTISIPWSQFSDHKKDRQTDQGTGQLDGWTLHYLFMLFSALFMMNFLIWEYSRNLLCLIDFQRNNKSAPCLLHKNINRKMWNIDSDLKDATQSIQLQLFLLL